MKKGKKKRTARKKTPVRRAGRAAALPERSGVFSRSLRCFRLSLLWIMLIDFMSHAAVFGLILYFWKLLTERIASIQLPASVFELTQMQVYALSSAVESSFYYIAFLIAVFPLFITLIWSASRALLWKMSFGDRITLKYVIKSIPLGIIWFGMGAIPAMIMLLTLRQDISMIAVMGYVLVFIYFSDMLFIKYAIYERIKIFGETLRNGIGRVGDMGIAYAVITAGYILLSKYAVGALIDSMAVNGMIISIAIYLLYFAWSRYLLIEIYQKRELII